MIIQPQDYDITLLEKHNALHKLILMEKSSLSCQNFNQRVVKILSSHKTNWIKTKKRKQKKKKMWQEKVERNCKGLCKDGGEAKRFRAGQERRCGKWIRINISSSIAWLLRKSIPIIQSRPAVNVSLMYFCWFFWGGFKAKPLSWSYSSNCKWCCSLIWRFFFVCLFFFSLQLLHLVSRD